MKEGQCSKRKGPGKGAESGGHTCSALGSGVRGSAASFSGFVLLLACGASGGIRPGILARQPSRGCGTRRSTLPSWTHEDTSVHARGRDRSPEERRTRHITAAVMRLHSLQVCLITRYQTWLFSVPLLSHTHSHREPGEGRRLRDGEMLIIRGRQPTRHTM